MRHGITILAVVAFVGVIGLLLSVSLAPGPGVLLTYAPMSSPVSDSIAIKGLEVGERIGQRYESFTGSHLRGLAPSVVVTQDSRSDTTQSLRLYNPPLFNGGQISFGQDERGETGDFLMFDDAVFEYQIEFGSGLTSQLRDGRLPDMEDDYMFIMGEQFSIQEVIVNGNQIEMTLFGGFGQVRLTDDDYTDNDFTDWVQINQENVNARVKINAFDLGNRFVISSITYILNADAQFGSEVYVPPQQCTRNYIEYPQGMLSPSFDICYAGLTGGPVVITRRGVGSNMVWLKPRGDDEYLLIFSNQQGRTYELPLAQLNGGLSYGNRGRDLIFTEGTTINQGDYFVVSSDDDNTGVTNVFRYNSFNPTQKTIRFEDLGGGSKETTFDASGDGQLAAGQGFYRFTVDTVTGDITAIDLDNDGSMAGGEAVVVTAGGQIVDLGPGFTVRMTTLSKLFDEATGDETTRFDIITDGGDISIDVPSPQGGTFDLVSEGGGVRSGSTRYGNIWRWDKSDTPGELEIFVAGAAQFGGRRGGGQAEVVVTMERGRLVQSPSPVQQAVCGNHVQEGNEQCDPPGSGCTSGEFFERGVCQADCTCKVLPRAVCGNNIQERGEACETDEHCPNGFMCSNCDCIPKPQPPVVEEPAPVQPTQVVEIEEKRTFWSALGDFWNWFTSLFGR